MKFNLALLFLMLIASSAFSQPCKTIIGYYPGWQWYDRSSMVNPNTIEYSKYSIINYAFLIPDVDGNIRVSDPWADKNILLGSIDWNLAPAGYDSQYDLGNAAYHDGSNSLVNKAHAENVKVMISIGGGGAGSENFPEMASVASARTNFAHWCCEIIRTYSCDGIDIDWEYPGFEDIGGTPDDTQHFNELLDEVRDSLDALEEIGNSTLLLTAAFNASPERMDDIEWDVVVPLLDYINFMTYDFFGSWDDITNHNSPLFSPGQGNPDFNLSSAVTRLIDQYHVPSQKINAGVAFYGRSVITDGAPGLHSSSTGVVDDVTFFEDEGIPLYYNLLNHMDQFVGHWDGDAEVPYLLGADDLHTFVSYDDEGSISKKAQYIIDHDLAGAIIWEITGDYVESGAVPGTIGATPLTDALNNGLCGFAFDLPDCANMCVTDISMSAQDGMVDITLVNGGIQVNYPIVMIIMDGDTLANIDQWFDFFAQLENVTLVHTVPTTLESIPQGFTCEVVIEDGLSHEFCILPYPCLPDNISGPTATRGLEIYPNPTNGMVNIHAGVQLKEVSICDLTGKKIRDEKCSANYNLLDMSGLSAGSYMIEVKFPDGVVLKRLINKN